MAELNFNAANYKDQLDEEWKAQEEERRKSKPWHAEGSTFSEEDRDILDEYYNAHINANSSLLGHKLESPEHVVKHVRLMQEAKAAQAKQQDEEDDVKPVKGKPGPKANPALAQAKAEFKAAWDSYVEACQVRKENIRLAQSHYNELVHERDKIFGEINLRISKARLAVDEAKAVPVPERPVKPGK